MRIVVSCCVVIIAAFIVAFVPAASASPPLLGDIIIGTLNADGNDHLRAIRPSTGETFLTTVGGKLPETPIGLVVDLDTKRVLMGEGEFIYAEDLDTGIEVVVSSSRGDFLPVGSGAAIGLKGLVIAADGTIVYTAWNAIRRLDPATGIRSTIATVTTYPYGISYLSDGDYLVTDNRADSLLRMDPATNLLTVISSSSVGTGPNFSFPRCAIENASGNLYVVDNGGDNVFEVDLLTGDRTIISGSGVGSGPSLNFPRCIAEAPDGRILVSDKVDFSGGETLYAIDPSTGDRSVLSSNTVGTGPTIFGPTQILVDTDGTFLLATGYTVLRIDPITGDRTELAPSNPGETPFLGGIEGMALDDDGSIVIGSLFTITHLAPETWYRTTLAYAPYDVPVGSGPDLNVRNITLHPVYDIVVTNRDSIVAVDSTTGDRTLLSAATLGTGPPLTNLRGSAVGPGTVLYVSDLDTHSILAVDLATGDRTIVSDGTTGTGPALNSPLAMAHEAEGTLLIVSLLSILRVDPATGNREIVSGAGTGSGMDFFYLADVDVNDAGEIFVTDAVFPGPPNALILQVDPVTGDRVEISVTSGPGVGYANRLAVVKEATPVPPQVVPALSALASLLLGVIVAGVGYRKIR